MDVRRFPVQSKDHVIHIANMERDSDDSPEWPRSSCHVCSFDFDHFSAVDSFRSNVVHVRAYPSLVYYRN